MTDLEQTVGGLVLVAGSLLVLVYGLGYAWYRTVTYPRARRKARRLGYVVLGENIFGDRFGTEWNERAARPGSFTEWRRVRCSTDEPDVPFWPRFRFIQGEPEPPLWHDLLRWHNQHAKR